MPIFPGTLRSKLPKTGTTIFAIMSALAKEQNAINLSQGFPDFPTSQRLMDLVDQHMRVGHNQYAPMPGIPALREAIATKVQELYTANYNPDTEITITAGATQAIYTAITALVNEGDEVIVFQPAYDCYVPAIQLAGGKPIFVDLEYPDYRINWESVKKLINQRTRMILINTPHNPSGMAMNAFDMMQLQKLTKDTDILVLSDEVYEHIIFDGLEHQSVLRFPELAKRSIVTYSFGKTFHNTGWKMGYAIAPENLMAEFRKVHQYLVFSVNTTLQHAFADYMKDKDTYMELGAFYQQKRDFLEAAMKGSRFKAMPCQGTYFALYGYKDISDETDTEYAKRLTIEHKVATIPLSPFYHGKNDNKVLRICFAKEEETLEQAAEKLCKV